MADEIIKTPALDFSKPLDVSVLKGQTALVTGAGSGIGKGVAIALAEAGAYVILVDKDVQNGEAAAEDLKAKGFHAKFVATDVTSYDAQLAAFKAAIDFSANSKIDIVVPAAGISGSSFVAGASPEDLAPDADPPPPSMKVLDIDLYGVFYSTHLAVHYFKKSEAARSNEAASRRPQVLFIASMAGYVDHALNSDYAAAKWGVRGIFRSLRSCGADLSGMRVNLLAPTFIRTGMTKSVIETVMSRDIYVGDVSDAVDGALRCLCDESVEGRAIAIGTGEARGGAPGSSNFDICDEVLDHDGGKAICEKISSGWFGKGFAAALRYTKKSREGRWTSYRQ